MCGRYVLSAPPDEVAQQFDCDVRDNFPARYNIAPTQPIAIIRAHEAYEKRHQRLYQLVRWGFIPEWAGRSKNNFSQDKPLINARSETVLTKPTFRNAFKRRRCLIPANGFYEWKTIKGKKTPFYCTPKDQPLFAFAGIWEVILDPGGGEMDTAAILTTHAGADLAEIHRREPIIIQPKDYIKWLSADERDLDDIFPLLDAAPAGFWHTHKAHPDVGNVRNDRADLVERYVPPNEPPEQGFLF